VAGADLLVLQPLAGQSGRSHRSRHRHQQDRSSGCAGQVTIRRRQLRARHAAVISFQSRADSFGADPTALAQRHGAMLSCCGRWCQWSWLWHRALSLLCCGYRKPVHLGVVRRVHERRGLAQAEPSPLRSSLCTTSTHAEPRLLVVALTCHYRVDLAICRNCLTSGNFVRVNGGVNEVESSRAIN
jgi:xanthine/CO dehydrogenase XdhC/CoxF family maturation factor